MYNEKFGRLERQARQHGERNDCSVKAVAITCRTNYKTAHKALADLGRKKRQGVYIPTIASAIKGLGFKIVRVPSPAKTLGSVAKHLQRGYYIVLVRGHVTAVHNGAIHDWTDEGSRRRVIEIWKIERMK